MQEVGNNLTQQVYDLLPTEFFTEIIGGFWDGVQSVWSRVDFITLVTLPFAWYQFLGQGFLFFIIFAEAVICILSMTSGDWLRTWIYYNSLVFGTLIRMSWAIIKYITNLLVEVVKFWA